MMNEWLNDYLKQLEGYPEKVLSVCAAAGEQYSVHAVTHGS